MDRPSIKPGWKSSEFWFTAVSFVFSGLYLIGLIGDNSQKEDLIRDVSHGVESIILIGGQLAILWKYINSRKEIKKTWWSTVDKEERKIADKSTNGEENNDNSRKPKSKPKTKTTRTSKSKPRKSK
jgi:hypothetical protein